MAAPHFYTSDDEVIQKNYPNLRLNEIIKILDFRFNALDIQRRAYELGIKHNKQDQIKPVDSQPKSRIEKVTHKLENLYYEIGQLSPFNEKYESILNEINNLEITYQNIQEQ